MEILSKNWFWSLEVVVQCCLNLTNRSQRHEKHKSSVLGFRLLHGFCIYLATVHPKMQKACWAFCILGICSDNQPGSDGAWITELRARAACPWKQQQQNVVCHVQHMVGEGNKKSKRAAKSGSFETGLETQVVARVYQAAATSSWNQYLRVLAWQLSGYVKWNDWGFSTWPQPRLRQSLKLFTNSGLIALVSQKKDHIWDVASWGACLQHMRFHMRSYINQQDTGGLSSWLACLLMLEGINSFIQGLLYMFVAPRV